MVDNMMSGDAMAQQRTEGYVQAQTAAQQANMMAMQQQFDGMMQQDMMEKQFAQQQRQQTHFSHLMNKQKTNI